LLVEQAEDYTYKAELQPRPLRLELVQVVALVDERVRESVADIESLTRLPMQLIDKYADIAVQHANLKRYPDGWFATIPGFQGVWAEERTPEQALKVLKEVVLDWTLLKIEHQDNDLPVIEEINLNDVL
jgi:predicted RNase H-like HicB family nuclease